MRCVSLVLLALLPPALLTACGNGGVADPDGPPETALHYVHIASDANRLGTRTRLHHASLNDNPSAIIIVTPVANPGGRALEVLVPEPLAVLYDAGIGRWFIERLGASTPMPDMAAFNVSIFTPSTTAFVYESTGSGAEIFQRSPLDFSSKVLITMRVNTSVPGTAAQNAKHIWTGPTFGIWTVNNQDDTFIPANVGFNIVALVPSATAIVQIWKAPGSAELPSDPLPLGVGDPGAIIHAMESVAAEGRNVGIGVIYDTTPGQWKLTTQAGGSFGEFAFTVVQTN